MTSRSWGLAGVALAFYGLMAFLILHPILFSTGTHVAGYDYFNYHWNFWWLRTASSTPGLSVYQTDFAMFPFVTNMGYHAFAAFWFPMWSLLEPLMGTLAAMNSIIFTACVLNGWLLFLLLRRECASPAASLLGGLALQAAPNLRYFYYNTHINLMDWFWLPALILIWGEIARAVDDHRTGRALLIACGFGIALWGLTLTDLQSPIFAAFLLVPYGLLTVWRSQARARLIAAGVLAVVIGFALLWFAGPFAAITQFKGTLATGTVEDRPGVPFPTGFLRMSDQWWEWWAPSVGAWIPFVVIGALVIGQRLKSARWRWGWFAVMLPPLIFALGPTLTIGDLTLPLPFRFLYAQTAGMFRMPWRLMPIAIIAGMAFAALAFTPLLNRMKATRGLVVGAALLLFIADVRLYESAPLTAVPQPYQFYETIRSETGAPYADSVVIEIPTGAATGELIIGDPRATQLQWYSITHQKRGINGFISRAPLDHYWYLLTDDPMLSWLGQRRYLEPENVERQMRARIPDWQIGYFVIHRDLIGRESVAVQEIIGFFNSLDDLVCPFTIEGEAVVYRTRWHPDGCPSRTPPETATGVYTLDIGSEQDVRWLGAGWHYAENIFDISLRWAGAAPQAEIYLDLPPSGYTLEIATQSFIEARTLSITVNGVAIPTLVTVSPDAVGVYTFQIPASALGTGEHATIALHYSDGTVPSDIGMGTDARRLALSVDWLRFTAHADF